MRAQLIPLDGGSPIEIVRDLTLVGRKEECDLRLDHKSVSKMHCVIVKTDGMLFVRDLGSTNGTRVNGQRIRRAGLLPNDQLTIAGHKFRVYLGPDAPPAQARPALRVDEHQHTQRIDPKDLAILKNAKAAAAAAASMEDSEELPRAELPLRRNALPDVYPDDPK